MLLALMLQFLSPDTFFINIAFTMIAAVVLGGSYHWAGAIIGRAGVHRPAGGHAGAACRTSRTSRTASRCC